MADTQREITRFTASGIAKLPPGTHTDPAQPGLQMRVREKKKQPGKPPKFSRTWLLRFKFNKEESRILLGHFPETTLDAARGLAREFREKASQGIDPRRARPRRLRQAPLALAGSSNRHSVEFLASEFLERHVKIECQRKRPEYVERILAKDVLPVWQGRDARAIEPEEVLELLDVIVKRGSAVMANRVASVLVQMFKYGIHRRIVKTSPVQLLYRPGGKEKPRKRALSEDELKAFFANVEEVMRFQTGGNGRTPRMAHVLRLLLLTGQRRGELALARWSDMKLSADAPFWEIPAENSKTGEPHVVPLSPAALAELKCLKKYAGSSAFVLPREDGKAPADPKLITRCVARNKERFEAIGVQPFTVHDLRRTCRTGLARLKVTDPATGKQSPAVAPHIAERVLGHAQEKIPGTYDVYEYFAEKREALNLWAAHLQGLCPQ